MIILNNSCSNLVNNCDDCNNSGRNVGNYSANFNDSYDCTSIKPPVLMTSSEPVSRISTVSVLESYVSPLRVDDYQPEDAIEIVERVQPIHFTIKKIVTPVAKLTGKIYESLPPIVPIRKESLAVKQNIFDASKDLPSVPNGNKI